MSKIAPTRTSWWLSIFWWAVTLVTLILIDDLFFGPAFWALSLLNPLLATVLAFLISFYVQVWVTMEGLTPAPRKLAKLVINRLMLARKSGRIVEREGSLLSRVTSVVSAVLMSLVVGGVLPVLLLNKSGKLSTRHLRRLSLLTSAIYATEFALIHGGYGLGALLGWLL